MKTQDLYPFDPTFTAPYTIFKQVGNEKFFVNSGSIIAKQKVIVLRKEYILADYSSGTNVKITNVLLVDSYYKRGLLHLILRDIRSQRVFTIDHSIEYPENDCTWLLIDLDYLIERENIKAIKLYCGCINDTKEKNKTEINHKSNYDDLLDLDL
jgi:hypothetical protein